MTPAFWAILLRPILLPMFFVVLVAPIAWLLYRLFPPCRLKIMLFKDRTGPGRSDKDRRIMIMSTIAAYMMIIAWCGIVADYRWW